jgi:hypothetical protein
MWALCIAATSQLNLQLGQKGQSPAQRLTPRAKDNLIARNNSRASLPGTVLAQSREPRCGSCLIVCARSAPSVREYTAHAVSKAFHRSRTRTLITGASDMHPAYPEQIRRKLSGEVWRQAPGMYGPSSSWRRIVLLIKGAGVTLSWRRVSSGALGPDTQQLPLPCVRFTGNGGQRPGGACLGTADGKHIRKVRSILPHRHTCCAFPAHSPPCIADVGLVQHRVAGLASGRELLGHPRENKPTTADARARAAVLNVARPAL